MEKTKIGAILVTIAMIAIMATPVLADTSDISIKWYIPSDTSISVQYPTGLSDVQFKPASPTFAGQDAESQADGTYAFNVTNTGNVAIDISGAFTGSIPANMDYFNLSTTFADETEFWWTTANDTSGQTIVSNLAISGTQGFYSWSSGTDVANSSYPITDTFRLTSTAH